jgi:hypothetical protein
MDRRERAGEFEEAIRTALDGRQAKMWTALPGVIESFNAAAMTCVVQTTIQAKRTFPYPNTSVALVTLPLCLNCPCQFPSGGGVTLTFPVEEGDECLVVFASRAIDGWWQSGGVQPPVEARMHDLSDGFVLLGFRSQPRVISDISTVSAQLRSDDGSTVIDLNPTAKTVDITAPGGSTITANVTITGNLSVEGNIVAGSGATGTLTTPTGQTVTVQNGIITNIASGIG